MSSGSVNIACPACRQVHAVPPELLGTAFTCPTCRATFVIPRTLPSPAPPPPMAIPVGPRPPHLGPAPMAVPVRPPDGAGPVPVSMPVPPATPVVPAAPITPHVPRIQVAVRPPRRQSRLVGSLLLGIVGLALAAGIAVPVYYLSQQQARSTSPAGEQADDIALENIPPRESVDETAIQEPATGAPPALGGPPRQVTWTNAAEDAVSGGPARVRVVRVEYGEVLARDERNQPTTAGPGEFLKIYLDIENRGDAPLRYVSWYGNHFAAAGQKVMARLWDEQGKPYPQQTFDRPRGIQGHTPESTLSGHDRVGDVLIFALPKSIADRADHSFRLELPGGAVRGRSFYRFRIPGSMLSKF